MALAESVRLIRRFSGVFTLAAGCLAVHVLIAPAQAETLLDTLSQAYSYNPRLDAERATLRATDEDVARANSGYRPDISASADVGRQWTKTRPDFGSNGVTDPRGVAVQLVQPIFRGFRTTNAVNSAESAVRAGRESLRDIEQQVLLDAVTAYGNVVRDQATVRLRENNLEFLAKELKATQDRFAVGEVTKTDVAQSEASRAQAVSDLDGAKANLKSSKAIYEQVVGQQPRNLVEPSPNSKLLPRNLEEAINIGTQENPQVVAALYREQGARYDVDTVRGELLPEAQVEATFQDRFDSSTTLEKSQTTSIVGRLNVPIYPGGGEVYARVRKAKQTHLARIQEIEVARAAAQSQVAQAWSQLVGAKSQIQSDKAQIEANKTALAGVREEEKVGQRTRIEVLDAQQRLLNSQVQLEITKRNVLVAAYTLIAAIGRLSVAEVGASGTVYDPEVHYDEVRRKWWGIDITHDDGRHEHIDAWQPEVRAEKPMK